MLPWGWQMRPLTEIRPEQGNAYISDLHGTWWCARQGSSPAVLLEDGAPVGPSNTFSHQAIRDGGNGQFCFWDSVVLFSASDNSDPRTNGKHYEVYAPAPIKTGVRSAVQLAAYVLIGLAAYLMITGLSNRSLPVTSLPGEMLRARFLGSPSFATAMLVFSVASILQGSNYVLHFRDPEIARTGLSILGVPYSDARGWCDMATSMASGQGMTAYWPAYRPGYGLFLALFFTWTGCSYVLAVVLNLLLTALAAALIYRIGEMLASCWVGAVVAFGFLSQNLTNIYPLTLATETLGMLCSVVTIHQLLRAIATAQRRYFLSAGAFFGLSNLVRPLTLPALPLILICVLIFLCRDCRWRGAVVRAAMLGAGAFLAVVPWLIRQWLVFGIVTLSGNTAENLYAATSPQYGSWTGALYREPGCPTDVKERYEYFMAKAKANLRENPGFYIQNVTRSYVAFFAELSASVRPHLLLLGPFALLGYYLCWGLRQRTPRRAGLFAIVVGLLAILFQRACVRFGPGLDLALLLLLPATALPRLAAIHVTGLLGSIAGAALFGMGTPDARILFVLQWGLLVAPPVVLWGCCERLAGLLKIVELPGQAVLPAAASEVLPRWFVLLRIGVVAFAVIGGIRLAALNVMTQIPPAHPQYFTAEQAAHVVDALSRYAPGVLHESELVPTQILTDGGKLNLKLVPGTTRPVFPTQDKTLVLPVRLMDMPYYVPGNTLIPHWSRFFVPREYDRTVCFFYMDGVPAPHYGSFYTPVSFRGFVPRRLMMKHVALVCRVSCDLSKQSTNEPLFLDGLAVIPVDEGLKPCMNDAYVVPSRN
jgi:hypothetical protein